MEIKEVKTAKFFATTGGGDIRCVSSDGEVRFELGLIAQILRGTDLVPYMAPGDEIEVTEGITVLVSDGGRLRPNTYGEEATRTGANPDFRPTIYSDAELRARKLLKDIQAATKGLEKRQAGLDQAMKNSAKKPAQEDPEPVIEEDPQEPNEGGEE